MTINKDEAIKLLRVALKGMVDEKCAYMRRKKLGNPDIEETNIAAVAALAATSHITPDAAVEAEPESWATALNARKLAGLHKRGYQPIGTVLFNGEDQYALFDSPCRWLTAAQYQRLMHEQDGSLFATPSPAIAPEASELPPTDERAEFEKWLGRPMMNPAQPTHYNGRDVRTGWEAWQERGRRAAIAMHNNKSEASELPPTEILSALERLKSEFPEADPAYFPVALLLRATREEVNELRAAIAMHQKTDLTDDQIDAIAKPYIGLGGVENYRAFARDIAMHQSVSNRGESSEREAFERHIVSKYGDRAGPEYKRSSTGRYLYAHVQHDWEVWQAAAEPVPTDLSKRLRALVEKPDQFRMVTVKAGTLEAAADEIDRYYGGMIAWKRSAEAKDAATKPATPTCTTCNGAKGHEKAVGTTNYIWVDCPDCMNKPATPAASEAVGVPTCPCGEPLCKVTQGADSMLNAEQFDAIKLGDWFCKTCPADAAVGGKYRYFSNSELAAHAAPTDAKQLMRERDGWKEKADARGRSLEDARQKLDLVYLRDKDQVWYWQGDGTDYPKSMSNSMAVVIRADQLREILRNSPLAAQSVRDAALEEAASVYMVGNVAAREIRKLKSSPKAPKQEGSGDHPFTCICKECYPTIELGDSND